MNQEHTIEQLSKQVSETELEVLKKTVQTIVLEEKPSKSAHYVLEKLINSKSLSRAKHYLKRLISCFETPKTTAYNDLNLNCWQSYDDVLTDSLWMIDKRDRSGQHHAGYWGNFVPQIPNQLLKRYTKKNDWVLDPFCGSGTTLMEAKKLNRKALGIELNPQMANTVNKELGSSTHPVLCADSGTINYRKALNNLGIKAVQFIVFHPPYWDIIKFSKSTYDLSQAKSMDLFLEQLKRICINACSVLESKRYCALVISDKYQNSEWIPLGFYAMQAFQQTGLVLKSIVVKNFNQTKAKRQQEQLWRYRALTGGYYVFKHEYIYVFQKP